MRAVNQCENLELNPSKEWEPMRKVKHEDRDGDVRGSRAISLTAAVFRTY